MKPNANAVNIFPINTVQKDASSFPLISNRQIPPIFQNQNTIALFHALWTHTRDGMRLTNEEGIVFAANKSYCKMVGIKERDLIGKPLSVVYGKNEEIEQLMNRYNLAFHLNLVDSIDENQITLKTGNLFEKENIYTFIHTDGGNKLLLAQFRDELDQKKTERILKDSEAKYHGLFANSIQPVIESSLDGCIQNANKSFLRLLGYQNFDEIINLNIKNDIYVDSHDREDILHILKTRGYIRNIEIQLKRKNGSTITVIENGRLLLDDSGTAVGIEDIFEDITAKKALEKKVKENMEILEDTKNKLSDLNAKKNKMISIVSHDLRSPFAGILGFCELLINENDSMKSEERLEYLRYIHTSAQDQLLTLNNLLDWSKIESGRVHFDARGIDLQDVVRRGVNSMLGLARQKNIHLSHEIPGKTFTHGDPQLLLQLFTNLIGNALKFTPAQGEITVELKDISPNYWTVIVRDNGIGIPEADIHKLFRIDEKYSRKGLCGESGTGLGLPMCDEIMKKHNGTISVESTEGKGTSFILNFLKVVIQPGEAILIVDDNPGVRVLHAKYIQRFFADAKIVYASDGEGALYLAKSLKPKLIISDHDMPNMNGLDLVKQFKQDPATFSIPVIIITGHDSKADREALQILNVTAVLNKPINQEQLEKVFIDMGLLN